MRACLMDTGAGAYTCGVPGALVFRADRQEGILPASTNGESENGGRGPVGLKRDYTQTQGLHSATRMSLRG
jgi:hypothetical protein